MSFPPATEMFQFAGFASRGYGFTTRCRRSGGFPHSEIPGSTLARSSPRLIAACYVLHRLSVPRHPPDALTCLIAHARCQTRTGRSSPQRRQNLVSRSNTPAPAGAFEREPFHDSMNHLVSSPPRRPLVEVIGLEPTTPCLQSRCSPD